ncbi:hypothetical protein [Salisediminibacterium selenitireducens]|uniref:Uncharacterized protein n=1 Tax=Bacillus selenitireducens (strain ATCC 700615 / DSM 15326 / MLS10) TaxID=439292 RepID=D6XYA6_BACIE|nr:hypothetical protein [Salisediminibacterium selenitireducens]ADI00175.1 hypothetical protein Bsel_2677 [[Bacillus] selenitireducens MLS10]
MSYANMMWTKMATDGQIVESATRRMEQRLNSNYGHWVLTYQFIDGQLPLYHFRLSNGTDFVFEFQVTKEVVLYVKSAGPFKFDTYLWRTIVNQGFFNHLDDPELPEMGKWDSPKF